uniref:GDSL esterase/lipase n=1 Tax=Leersia perrieri TaxID=77586 RepID=A0A0D9X234_9ORYZ
MAALPRVAVLVAAALILSAASASPAANGTTTRCYSHLFTFGDSLIDTGNFIHYSTSPGPVAHSPYGVTFFHRPTGRWSDGRLIVDFIVERLRFPYWTPYLAGKSKEDFNYGANFAVASGTAVNQLLFKKRHLSITPITPYSLAVQIGWFKKVLAIIAPTDQERKEVMSRSIFMVGEFGGNDYLQPLFQNKTLDWVRPLVPRVVRYVTGAIESLINLGATTVYVPGLFPLGCVPRLLFLFRNGGAGEHDPTTGCLRGLNDGLTIIHNNLLRQSIAELREKHPGVTIVYADYYNEVMELVKSPVVNGFDAGEVLTACCAGGGPYNGNFTLHCSDPGVTPCADPSRRISWDGLHMTEAVYRIMARGLLDGPFADPPIMSRCHGY